MSNGRILPPTYLFASLAIMVLLHFFIPVYQLTPYPWNASGMIPLALGIVLNLATDNAFKKRGASVNPFEEPTVLITSGAFNYSRNPMCLGMVMILIGVAFLLGSLSPFIIIPVFAITMDRIFIVTEENMLKERFDDEWMHYKTNVRRWI